MLAEARKWGRRFWADVQVCMALHCLYLSNSKDCWWNIVSEYFKVPFSWKLHFAPTDGSIFGISTVGWQNLRDSNQQSGCEFANWTSIGVNCHGHSGIEAGDFQKDILFQYQAFLTFTSQNENEPREKNGSDSKHKRITMLWLSNSFSMWMTIKEGGVMVCTFIDMVRRALRSYIVWR